MPPRLSHIRFRSLRQRIQIRLARSLAYETRYCSRRGPGCLPRIYRIDEGCLRRLRARNYNDRPRRGIPLIRRWPMAQRPTRELEQPAPQPTVRFSFRNLRLARSNVLDGGVDGRRVSLIREGHEPAGF